MARFDFMSLDLRPFGSSLLAYSTVNKSHTLSGTTNFIANIFQIKEKVSITHLGLMVDNVVGSPPQYRISLKSIDSDGLPSCVLISKVFIPETSWSNTFHWIEIPTTYHAVRGEKVALCIDHYSGFVNTNNCMWVRYAIGGVRASKCFFPYSVITNNVRSGEPGIYGYKTSSRSYGLPIKDNGSTSALYPGQIGIRMFLGTGYGTSYKLSGSVFEGKIATTSNQTFSMTLYDINNVVLNSITIDCDQASQETTADSVYEYFFDDATLANLSFGKEYFLAFAPEIAGQTFSLQCLEVENSGDLTAFPGSSNFYLVTRDSAANEWTRVRTKRPQMDLIIDDWSE